MIVPGKCQRLVEQKLAALKKAQALVLCARFESGSYLAISLEALAPDIFNIYEGRDASETSALQGAIREAMKSIRESDPTAIASPGIEGTAAHIRSQLTLSALQVPSPTCQEVNVPRINNKSSTTHQQSRK